MGLERTIVIKNSYKHHLFVSGFFLCSGFISCSPAQEACDTNVSSSNLVPAEKDALDEMQGQGLGGLLYYNSPASLDPSQVYGAEHIAARSVFFWFYKDQNQYRVLIFGQKYKIDDSAQRDHVLAVWVGDGYVTLPVKGLLAQGIHDFVGNASLMSGVSAPMKMELVSSLFGMHRLSTNNNGVTDGTSAHEQWCFVPSTIAGNKCQSPDKMGVIIASLDTSDLGIMHAQDGSGASATKDRMINWFDRFIEHQNIYSKDEKFKDLLIVHKAIYDNDTRRKALEAKLSSLDAKFEQFRDQEMHTIHDCKKVSISEFRNTAGSQSGSVNFKYCLPGYKNELSLEFSIDSGTDAAIAVTESERKALLAVLLQKFYDLASNADDSEWYLNFNKIGDASSNPINNKLSYKTLTFSEVTQTPYAVNSLGFQKSPDAETGHFFINYKDKDTQPHTQFPDFNYDFQQAAIITYKKLFPIQALPNRDSLGESGGAAVNRLPVTKKSARSASSPQVPTESDAPKEAGDETHGIARCK